MEKGAAMRLIGVASTVFTLMLTFVTSGIGQAPTAEQRSGWHGGDGDRQHPDDGERTHRDGQVLFRYDSFCDEQVCTDVLRMYLPISRAAPAPGLAVGVKVDV